MKTLHWTSHDLEMLPEASDDKRYEIIEGELQMSRQPNWQHQFVSLRLLMYLQTWSDQTHLGMANFAPGLIFAEDDDVAPDAVWISRQRLQTALHEDGKLHAAPELVVEVLSPGSLNERRDRDLKLKLYSRRGVSEYWIIDWRQHRIEVYRRTNAILTLDSTLDENDTLQSPLLPGFQCKVSQIFADVS